MITTLIIASLIVYLAIGTWLGRRDVPYFIADQRRRYPNLHDPDYERYMDTPEAKLERARSVYPSAIGWWVVWILFWPLMFPITCAKRLLVGHLLNQVERIDPKIKEAQMAAMQKRIEELEQELRIQ